MKKLILILGMALLFFSCTGITKEKNKVYTESKVLEKNKKLTYQEEVLLLVNSERKKVGAKPLKLNEELCQMALEKANDMSWNKYFSHDSPKYGSPFQHMKQNGIPYRTAAENIAKGQKTPEEVMKSWMDSKGHRTNILNPKFEKMGISKDIYGNNVWVQAFTGSLEKQI